MSKLLLDTNFLLDFVQSHRPGAQDAVTLFRLIASDVHEGYISSQSLKDFYYVFRKGQSDEIARDWIRVFLRVFTIEELDIEICTIALESDEPDFEDGCIRATAERIPVEFIISNDRKAFARSWVKAYSAREFLELFPPKEGVPV